MLTILYWQIANDILPHRLGVTMENIIGIVLSHHHGSKSLHIFSTFCICKEKRLLSLAKVLQILL